MSYRRVVSAAWNHRVAVVVLLLLVTQSITFAQPPPVRRVLILNEAGTKYPAINLIDQGIRESLQTSKYRIEFYREYLETFLFPDEADQQQIREFYIRKYRNRRPDVIITVGPSALQFMAEAHKKSFPGIPIVFCLSNGFENKVAGDVDFTGVRVGIAADTTLRAALRLLPDTKRVVVLGGSAAFDHQQVSIVKDQLSSYKDVLDISYLTDVPMSTLVDTVKRLPNHTIVLLSAIGQDATGTKFTSAEVGPLISSTSRVPVFGLFDVFINHGEVGGDLSSLLGQGRVAGKMVLSVLDGARPRDIPVANAPHSYMFDWHALQRWGLKEANLPRGSVVLNRQPTTWEAFKWYIVAGVSLMFAEAMLIFGLLWQRSKRKRAETELALTYDRLRLAVESGRSVSWDWDIKTECNRWSGALNTVFGIPSDHYVGRVVDFWNYVHPEDRDLVQRAMVDSEQSRAPYSAEFRLIRSDQTIRWIAARGQFHYAKNGDPELMLGMALDITDRKQMEEKIRESEQRLEGIIASAMDAIIVTDAEQRVVLFNGAAEELFGCPSLEAVGSPIERFVCRTEEDRLDLRTLGASGVLKRSMGTLGAVRGLRVSGEQFPIEATISQSQSEARELFTVIVRDVSARLKAEQAVQESERRFRLVANTAPVMIWMSSTDKLCNYFNQPWLDFTGRPLEAELGNGWAEGVHAEDLERCLDTYTRAFDLREKFEMQYRLRRQDGEYRWMLDLGVPRFNVDGTFAGYIGSCIDVTDRKTAEEALATVGRRLIEAHEEERTRIGRELHDDINQRLTLCLIELDLWQQKLPPQSGFEEQLRRVRDRIAEIGFDVQALSHRLHSSHLEYLGLVTAAESFCQEFAEKQKVEIEFRHSSIPSKIPKEVSLSLFRVLQEAVQNAVKHSGVQHFRVELRGQSGEIEMSVSDNGAGFDQREAMKSAGLGLISMRERVQLVNGEFSIDSKPGRGTTIRARVPVREREHYANVA